MKKMSFWSFFDDPYVKKIIKILRINYVLTFLFVFSAVAGQEVFQEKISLNLENVSLMKLFKEIQDKTGMSFMYNEEHLKNFGSVDMKVKDESIENILKTVFKNTNFEYRLENGVIMIKGTGKSKVQQTNSIKIKGTVKDEYGNLLPGVTIRIKGTSVGTATDVSGEFDFDIPEMEDIVLIITFIGMEQTEVKYDGQSHLNIVLKEDIKAIEEVVVTGMFNKPKESYTGSVNVITSEEIKNFSSRNLVTTIANLEPSFNLLSNNYAGSNPNALPNVQIRGVASLTTDFESLKEENQDATNLPLILLDGFEIDLEEMMDMNENEIETIHILKDASATALYGSKAASGVIVITTKEPEPGKLKITYDANASIEVPDLSQYRLLNSRDKIEYEKARGRFSSSFFGYNEEGIALYNELLAEVERGVDTYWLSKPLRTPVSPTQYLKLEGGSQEFRYYISFRYKNLNGVMKKSSRETTNGEISLLYKSSENLYFRNVLTVDMSTGNNSPYGKFSDYAKANPYYRTHDENGALIKLYYLQEVGGLSDTQTNPLYNSTIGVKDYSNYTKIQNKFSINWIPFEGLNLKANLGLSRRFDESHDFKPADHTAFDSYTGDDILRKGSYTYISKNTNNFKLDLNGFYTKTFVERHMFQAGFNYKIEQKTIKSYKTEVEGFPGTEINSFAAALQYKKDGIPSGSDSKVRDLTLTSNIIYYYDSRYVIDGSYTFSGSSLYGSNNRWGEFYSIGLGWNIHNEKFFQNDIMNRLKLRFTHGTSGSRSFDYYMGYTVYEYKANDRYGVFTGANLVSLGNPDLKWQSTQSENFGIELGFLQDRIYLEADYYIKTTKDAVTSQSLPYSNGFSSIYENLGDLDNKGVEIKLVTNIIKNPGKRINWNVVFNIVHEKGTIKKLSNAMVKMAEEYLVTPPDGVREDTYYRDISKVYKVGDDTQAFYAVKSLGIDPATGKELYLKRNGDITYEWSAYDKVKVGTTNPKARGNFNTTFRWKDLTVTANFSYSWGAQQYNKTLIDRVENANYRYNVDKRVFYDRWQKPGDKTFFKGINETGTTYASSRFVQDEKILECKNLMVRYDFGNIKWVQNNLKTQYLTLQFDTNDLFYLTSIKRERGLNYPFSRVFNFKLSAAF